MVSVCTPTFNRRPFIPIMFDCFRNQTYPKSRVEWIIVDDGTDKIADLVSASKIPQIQYFALDTKLTLGAKRNYMHQKAKGSIIVYMDDDDYYPPERIEHAVETLQRNPKALCAGSSEMYLYFKHIQKMYQCGPYGPNHATAGTFAFRRELLEQTQYESEAALAEEKAFLKDYTVPFVQLNPMKTILVFSHEQNTFDKRKLLEQPPNKCFQESNKRVEDFIHLPKEQTTYDFFMRDIDPLLAKYEPGNISSKPDVIQQIKEIEKKRAEEAEKRASQQPKHVVMTTETGEQKILTPNEIIELFNQKDNQIQMLMSKIQEQEQIIASLQQSDIQSNPNP